MWMKLCVQGRIGFLSQPLLLYRWHQGNASHAYRFEHGVREVLTARCEALRYYAARTGEHEKVEMLLFAVHALAEAERRGAALDRQSEKQLAYIRELEQQQAKLWAEVRRVGKSWEEQARYIKEVEGLRDTLWADAQRVGKSWEEQHAYIQKQHATIEELERTRDQLVAEQARRWSAILRRVGKKMLRRLLRTRDD